MNDSNNKEIELLKGQMIGILLFILSLFVSLLLAYNEKLSLEKKEPILNAKQSLNIAFFNRLAVVLLGGFFLYDSYVRKERKETEDSNIDILASWLALLASILLFYIVWKNYNNQNFDISEVEEPTL